MRTPLPAPRSRPLPYGALVGIVAILYLAKEVLIPLALAILFSFLLGPVVRRFERIGLWRVPSVLVVAAAFFGIFAAVGWITAHQVVGLADKLPAYQGNIQHKLQDLSGRGGALKTAATVLANIEKKSESPAATPGKTAPVPALLSLPQTEPEKPPLAVRIVDPPIGAPQMSYGNTFGSLLVPLSTAFIVVVFTIFMLIEREDLRDRLLQLAGPERLPITTQAVDEAGQRVSRYLLMQVTVNVIFGAGIALGLFFIGVPAPALWGILAASLRFVPYVGVWVSAAGPLAVATGAFASSWPVALTLGLFVALELVTGNAVEPWLYGTSTGMSPVAMHRGRDLLDVAVGRGRAAAVHAADGLHRGAWALPAAVGIPPHAVWATSRSCRRMPASTSGSWPPTRRRFPMLVDEYLVEHPGRGILRRPCSSPRSTRRRPTPSKAALGADRHEWILQTTRTLVDELRDREPRKNSSPRQAVGGCLHASEGAAPVKAAPVLPSVPVRAEDLPLRVLILPRKNCGGRTRGRHALAPAHAGRGRQQGAFPQGTGQRGARMPSPPARRSIVCLSLVRPFRRDAGALPCQAAAHAVSVRFENPDRSVGLETPRRRFTQEPPDGARGLGGRIAGGRDSQVCPLVHCLPNPGAGSDP